MAATYLWTRSVPARIHDLLETEGQSMTLGEIVERLQLDPFHARRSLYRMQERGFAIKTRDGWRLP